MVMTRQEGMHATHNALIHHIMAAPSPSPSNRRQFRAAGAGRGDGEVRNMDAMLAVVPAHAFRAVAAAGGARARRVQPVRCLERTAAHRCVTKASHLKKKFLSFARVYQKKNGC